MHYLLSLIVIAYNSSEYIEDCLNSVFSQTYKDFETVIINNASTDDTDEKIQALICDKPNVRYIKNPENAGGATAGNLGIKEANGDYVFLMDSDDILPKGALEALGKAAENTKGDIVIGRAKCIYGDEIGYMKFNADDLTWAKPGEYSSLKENPDLAIAPFYWGRIIRRQMLVDNGIFMKDGRLNADRYFTLNALKHSKKTVVIDELCYLWRRFLENGDRVSVSRGNTEEDAFRDRMLSIHEADSLFEGFSNRKMRKFVKLQAINRLLIYAKDAVNNIDFRVLYVKSMKEYLSDVSMSEIYKSPYFSARRKTMCLLLKNGRTADFCNIADPENKLQNEKNGNSLDIIVDINDVPKDAKRQNRMHIAAFSVSSAENHGGAIKIDAVSKVWQGCDGRVLNLRLIKENGEEICTLGFADNKKGSEYSLKTEIKLENIKEKGNCNIVAEYLVNGIFNTSVFKKDNEVFIVNA